MDGYELLRNKDIIQILDGDTLLDENKPLIKMPYLSGPVLCYISEVFSLPVVYGSQSRWIYLDELLAHCIREGTCSQLIAYLFDKAQFQKHLTGMSYKETEAMHQKIVGAAIERINGILYFNDYELVTTDKKYYVKPKFAEIEVDAPSVRDIDRDYIIGLTERANKDIDEGNYDSAITKSRTLLEEVFCYVIEKKDKKPVENGKIDALYSQVKDLYNMHDNVKMDERLKTLLSGLESILSAISQMRNKNSDSHGAGSKRINIDNYHARLFVNAAVMMSDFILSVATHNLSYQ